MCMGMGFPVGMGMEILWDSHENGNGKQISNEMGMEMEMISWEWECWKMFCEKKSNRYQI